MIRLLSLMGAAALSMPALAAKPCEELKTEIAERMAAKGVSGFQLDIVATSAADARVAVGSCEGGNKKILYSRGTAAPAAAVQAGNGAPVAAPAVAVLAPSAPAAAKPTPVTAAAAVLAPKPNFSVPVSRPAPQPSRSAAGGTGIFRDTLDLGGAGPEMVVIPAGAFVMGSAIAGIDRRYRENPEHAVALQAFALARTETTFEDYDRFATATGRRLPADAGEGRGMRPVVNVTWTEATAYAQWLTERTGFTYRLASEAEWEYAARASGKRGAAYSTGDCISGKQANFNDSGTAAFNNCPASNIVVGAAQPVASYAANAFGLYDMHGNVFEWTADCVHLSYEQAPGDGSPWLKEVDGNCGERIVRGGSWQSGQASVRSSLRAALGLNESSGLIGFRVARAMPAAQR